MTVKATLIEGQQKQALLNELNECNVLAENSGKTPYIYW